MGIRDTLSNNPRLGIVFIVVVLAAAGVLLVNRLRPESAKPFVGVTKLHYTDDDGKTFFADAMEKVSATFTGPNGKEAVRAFVGRYPNEQPLVLWMEKYTPRGKQLLASFYADAANKGLFPPESADFEREKLMKRPGMSAWIAVRDDPASAAQIKILPRRNGELPAVLAPESK